MPIVRARRQLIRLLGVGPSMYGPTLEATAMARLTTHHPEGGRGRKPAKWGFKSPRHNSPTALRQADR